MLNWTCKNTVLQFNGKYYTQLDGVAMGSPIAPLMADVLMNWLVDNVSKIGCSPQILSGMWMTFSVRLTPKTRWRNSSII